MVRRVRIRVFPFGCCWREDLCPVAGVHVDGPHVVRDGGYWSGVEVVDEHKPVVDWVVDHDCGHGFSLTPCAAVPVEDGGIEPAYAIPTRTTGLCGLFAGGVLESAETSHDTAVRALEWRGAFVARVDQRSIVLEGDSDLRAARRSALQSAETATDQPARAYLGDTRGGAPLRRYTESAMHFMVLGPLQIMENGEPIVLGGHRQRSVLALLTVDVGMVVPIDRIVSEIWPDETVVAVRDSLYTYVSQLRKALGRDRVVRSDGGYRLALLDTDEIDSVAFETTVRGARRLLGSNPETAGHLLDSALGLWRGRPYEGFEDLASLVPEAARLEELQLDAEEDRIAAELRAGGTPTAADIDDLCGRHPYRERLWRLLARTLYRAGRQADALRAFTRLRSILGEDLGLEVSPETARLEEQILLQDPVLEPDAAPPRTNVPIPVSSFVGRIDELTLLDKAIHEHRLVTVVGPGGVGKTRLAIEAAGNVRGSFRDGVWFVDLAQVSQPELVPQAIAAALQVAEHPDVEIVDSIAAFLRPRTTLLVVDNCEHVADRVAATTAAFLENAPNLKVLATSRQLLGIRGEVRFALEGLATSADDEVIDDANRLFEARAAAVRSGFALGEDSQSSVASICRSLDGMPLAIELVAARVDVLSPSEIEGLLTHRLALLADDPSQRSVHRSLQASMDWSYDMLPADGRRAFDLLGVFEGPFSVEAAAAVLDFDSGVEAVEQIRLLVRASLIQVTMPRDGRPLYRLLETPRMYARVHLTQAGMWEDAIERHDAHYREACEELRSAFFGRERLTAQQQIELELADYHETFDRLVQRGAIQEALSMGWPLGHLWLFSGRLVDGERRLTAVLSASGSGANRLRADVLTVASFLTLYRQQFDQSIEWADEAVGIYRLIGDEQGLAYALARRGHVAFVSGDGPTALTALQESLSLSERIGFDDGTAWPITLLAQARRWSGDESSEIPAMLEEGRRRFVAMGEVYGQVHADMILATLDGESLDFRLRFSEEMVRLGERPGADILIKSAALHALAYGVWDAGDLDRAEGLNRASARSAFETGATVNTGLTLRQAATFAGQRGKPERCAILFGAGKTHFAMAVAPFQERAARPAIELATEALGEDLYQELYDQGAGMSVEEATDYLLNR